MKHFFIDYALNFIVALIVLSFGGFLFDMGKTAYYTYAPLDNFYESIGAHADDACIEVGYHNVESVRFVKQTDVGYPATVIREMFLIKLDDRIKIHEEKAEAFVEVIPDGVSRRQQRLPENIEPGTYQWEIAPTIIINGVERQAPIIRTNEFEVLHCIN